MAEPPFAPERRMSGVADRRRLLGRGGGRRATDSYPSDLITTIACPACHIAWASISAVGYGADQSTVTYICPRCGHQEKRVSAA
jgi:hypothetical protein